MQRYRTLFLTLALLTAPLTFIVAPGAADPDCNLLETGTGTAGLADAATPEWSFTIPAACQGIPFTLTGSTPGDDFDVEFDVGSHANDFGDESGAIPDGATSAAVTYYAGVAGTWTFQAVTPAEAGDNARTPPVTLYLASGPTGIRHVDQAAGGDGDLQEGGPSEGTQTAPIVFGADGPAVDARWTWAPENGFSLAGAPVTVSFWNQIAGSSLNSVALYVELYADGTLVANAEVRADTSYADPTLTTADLGPVTANGDELTLIIDPRYVDTSAGGVILSGSDYPSTVVIAEPIPDTTAPGAINNLTAIGRNDTALAAAWDEATDDVGVSHYEVQVAEAGVLAYTVLTDSNVVLLSDLVAETTYDVTVRALDASGNAGAWNTTQGTTLEEGNEGSADATPRNFAVIAVIDSGYSVYHQDFLGAFHPWNTDSDPSNDFDFTAHPSTYIDGYPEDVAAIDITIPSDGDNVNDLRTDTDADAWDQLEDSGSADVNLYWIPGTKVIGAASFSGTFQSTNSAHGTRSAASAGGNIHGTCPACLFVLIKSGGGEDLAWAASQPWIDVVTNSYGRSLVGGPVRDNIYGPVPLTGQAPLAATKAGTEDGGLIVFSAGNGLANAFVVPMNTYLSSEKGPDWIVTVGAVTPTSHYTYSGAGKPVDISGVGSSYPSTGGNTWDGTGTHSGTSNAAPTVAGTFAQVLMDARAALGDTTPGHAGGVVASGTPNGTGPLADGELTRDELEDLVFLNVLPDPSTGVAINTAWPNSQYNYYYQGHGVISGLDDDDHHGATMARIRANMLGEAGHADRPAGEENWFTVDSFCRQRMWGDWTGGYFDGTNLREQTTDDGPAYAFAELCSELPERAFD